MLYYCVLCLIGYEPADLTVHPLRTAEGEFIFFRIGVYCLVFSKNAFKEKPEYFEVIHVKRHKNVFFQHIHSNSILINLTFLNNNE